jgi:hypothetical protein
LRIDSSGLIILNLFVMIPEVQSHQPDPLKDLYFPGVFFVGKTGIYAKRSSFKQAGNNVTDLVPGAVIVQFTETYYQPASYHNKSINRHK